MHTAAEHLRRGNTYRDGPRCQQISACWNIRLTSVIKMGENKSKDQLGLTASRTVRQTPQQSLKPSQRKYLAWEHPAAGITMKGCWGPGGTCWASFTKRKTSKFAREVHLKVQQTRGQCGNAADLPHCCATFIKNALVGNSFDAGQVTNYQVQYLLVF